MLRDKKAKQVVFTLAGVTDSDSQEERRPRYTVGRGKTMFGTQLTHLSVSWYPLSKFASEMINAAAIA